MRGHRGAKGRRRVGLGLPSAFTSDGNSNESDSSDLDGDHAGKRSHSVRAADSRLMPEEEEEVTPPIKGKRLQKSKGGAGQLPRPARRTSRKKGLNSKLSSDEDAPVHRKARTIRSLRQIDQHREREVIHKRGAAKQESSSMSRPSCSAKKKRYYLGESDRTDSEGEEDTDGEEEHEEEEEDESSEEEESSEKASEDSEDELIPRTRRGAKQISPKSKKTAANRHSLKRTKSKIVSEEEEGEGSGREEVASDSDPSPPSKRCRLQRSSTPKKQLRKSPSAREPAPRRKPRPGKASGSSSRETRNRGQQRVTYTEEYYSDDYDEGEGEEGGRSSSTSGEQHSDSDGRDGGLEASSVSSRGRVRKLTARARASLRVA